MTESGFVALMTHAYRKRRRFPISPLLEDDAVVLSVLSRLAADRSRTCSLNAMATTYDTTAPQILSVIQYTQGIGPRSPLTAHSPYELTSSHSIDRP